MNSGIIDSSTSGRLVLRRESADEAREELSTWIELTRLNGHRFSVNCDLIKYVEAAPDTTLTLVTGEKLLVTETPEAVVELILGCRVQVLRNAWPGGMAALAAKLAFDAPSEQQHKDSESLSPAH